MVKSTHIICEECGAIGKVDITMKEWLEIPEVFAELFNGAVLKGKRKIRCEDLLERNSDYVVSIKNKNGEQVYEEKFRDVVNRCDSELGLMVLAVENQEDVCNIMPVRNMMYDAMCYEKNIREIVARNENEGKKISFTQVIDEDQKIMPLVTVVLYTGKKKWTGPKTLSEMWNISDETKEILKNDLNDYKIHIIDANHMEQEEIENYKGDVKSFFYILSLLNQNKSMKSIENNICVKYSKTASAIGVVRNRKIYDDFVANREGEINMKQIEDVWFEEGEKKGEQKHLIGMVCKKLDKNKTPEVIADELEEDFDVINNICSVAERVVPRYDVEEIYGMLHEDTEYGKSVDK